MIGMLLNMNYFMYYSMVLDKSGDLIKRADRKNHVCKIILLSFYWAFLASLSYVYFPHFLVATKKSTCCKKVFTYARHSNKCIKSIFFYLSILQLKIYNFHSWHERSYVFESCFKEWSPNLFRIHKYHNIKDEYSCIFNCRYAWKSVAADTNYQIMYQNPFS